MQYKLPISIIIISLFASLASSAPKGAKRLSDLDQDNNGQINFEEIHDLIHPISFVDL